MKKNEQVSVPVIKRLPRYHRYLEELKNSGIVRISSKELSQRMGLTASQIRQDLNCFGGFGQQGYGYNIEQLYNEIGEILGLNNRSTAILMGAGNLGKALVSHHGLTSSGFNLIGIFDNNPSIVGQKIGECEILSVDILEDFCKEKKPDMAILCIPSSAAAHTTVKLIDLGIKGFWNFTQYDIAHFHKDVSVENVHLSDSLMTLCYQINNKENSDVIDK